MNKIKTWVDLVDLAEHHSSQPLPSLRYAEQTRSSNGEDTTISDFMEFTG